MTQFKKKQIKKTCLDQISGFWIFPVVNIYSCSRGIRCSGQNRAIPASRSQKLGKTTLEKLHPCIETLNSRNLGLAKDSFKVSFGFRTLSRPRLIKDTKNVKNHWFYCVFAQKCIKKPLVLLCFRLKMLKNQWFYYVFARKC